MKIKTLPNKILSTSRYFMNSTYAGIPLEIFLILIDECNYKCKVCSLWSGIYKDKRKSFLTLAEIKKLIDEASKIGIPTMIISGGEPLLHPDIIEILEYSAQKIENVRLNTNASLMNTEIASRFVQTDIKEVWISLDGIGDYYDNFRGVKDAFNKTTNGIIVLNEAKKKYNKKTPRILIDTIVTHNNITQITELINLLAKLDVNEMTLTHTWYIPPYAVNETAKLLGNKDIYCGQFSTPTAEKHTTARLQKENLKLIKKAAREKNLFIFIDPLLKKFSTTIKQKCKCLSPWTNIEIFPWGDVCVCPILDKLIIGNIKENSLMEIWNSAKMREIRKVALKGFEVCRYCILYRRTPFDHITHPQTLKRVLFG